MLVPHLRKRPFTMKRYPDGWQGKRFFQKEAPSHIRSGSRRAVRGLDAGEREAQDRLPIVDDELGLLWMVNMGCIDMNAWASRADQPERPD